MKKIKIFDETVEINGEESLYEIIKRMFPDYKKYLGARVANEVKSLYYRPTEGAEIQLIDITDPDGYRIYSKTLSLVFIMATKELFPESNAKIEHALGSGLYATFDDQRPFTFDDLKIITSKMEEIIDSDYPIIRDDIDSNIAYSLFEKFGYQDKIKLFKSLGKDRIDIYNINGHIDTFHGYLAPTTGYANVFELKYYYPGVLIFYPNRSSDGKIPEVKELKKLAKVFEESSEWSEIMNLSDVGSLNEKILQGQAKEIIKISEAFHEKKIANLADVIVKDRDIHLILIAGPSSSGKTTFANRLMMQLKVNGKRPVMISVDDYFVNRVNTPLNEDGSYDYETIDAIDVKKLNEDLIDLLEGREVEIPSYNFFTGEREYRGNYLKVESTEPIILEGIHCLNPKLTSFIPNKNKYKIYISALTQLSIDSHNRIPTTDARFLRRMVRDSKFRGNPPEGTFAMWQSVRRGEEKYIFPFQEEADIMFDSALAYELAVLKKHALPMLQEIGKESPYYSEAKKLIRFLQYFIDIKDESPISVNSILREFIGEA